MCHDAGREAIHGYADFPLLPVEQYAALYERVARPVHAASVDAGMLDTRGMTAAAAREAVDAYSHALGVPATDPVRFDADEVLGSVL
jgi:uncharacterized NAD-dependent epimerase/dehydratase family protein